MFVVSTNQMKYIDGDFLREIVPFNSGERFVKQNNIINEISDVLGETLNKYDINTSYRVAQFIGQITHECDGFCTTEEYASGKAYEGRKDLGNTVYGDGVRYKGRGLIQLTGKVNYKLYGELLDIDLLNNPMIAADPKTSLLIACEYWKQRNLNKYADKNDLVSITRKINGGLNGIDSRLKYYKKAKSITDILFSVTNHFALSKGSQGYFVKILQKALNTHNYNLLVDGDFGGITEKAVIAYKHVISYKDNDGVVSGELLFSI